MADYSITAYCNSVMVAFATACSNAAPDSRVAKARTTLGEDRFLDVAMGEIRKAVKAELVRPGLKEELEIAGELAVRASIATVLGDTIKGVVAAAGL